MCRYTVNRFRELSPHWSDQENDLFSNQDIAAVHRSLPEYQPTPTLSLPGLANGLAVRNIFVKDESHRFGLKAFKALGASYAIYRWVVQRCRTHGLATPTPVEVFDGRASQVVGDVTFCTATDGNHGRGVAWVSQKLGRPARIYMPADTVQARIDAIRLLGAEVTVVDGNYDHAVRHCLHDAENHRWQIISDTSWPGYLEIPRWVMAAYTTIFRETHDQLGDIAPDLIIVQGGVGALAAAAAWYYNPEVSSHCPKLVCVEPMVADCLTRSAESPNGEPVIVQNSGSTIMAGLNCGTPSPVAWPLIRTGFDGFVVIDDTWCRKAMRKYYHPLRSDPRIISGESGAASLAALLAIQELPALSFARSHLQLTDRSSILLINTEGDTDPVSFHSIVSGHELRL